MSPWRRRCHDWHHHDRANSGPGGWFSDHRDEWRIAQLRRHRDALDRALRAHLPGWSWTTPAGGWSLWARLGPADGSGDPPVDAGTFAQTALRHGVAIVPGRLLSVADRHPYRVRLAYAEQPGRLDAAVRRLAAAWAEATSRPAAR